MMKWISHERRIILHSSFLCHPINEHGIDHEAIAMRRKKKKSDTTEILVNCCAVSLQLFCIRSQNDGDRKTKSSWRHQNGRSVGRMLCTVGARFAASMNILDRLRLN